jgi:hypothetical protein
MNERDLSELKDLANEARGDLKKLETVLRELNRKEARIMELLSGEVAYERSLGRGPDETREMLRRAQDHNFLRRVSRLLPDLEREVERDREVVSSVREDLEDVRVMVGDTEMTLGSLLRALENAE